MSEKNIKRKEKKKIMKPIYEPRGAAKEYGDYALNIYTGCPARCFYCFAPGVLRKDKEAFHTNVAPREGIVEATKAQLEREGITNKTIHLCFTCDPYPAGYDSSVTREIVSLLKDAGNHVQILTKNAITRDFDLLDENDWYGITLDGTENPYCMSPAKRIEALKAAHEHGIHTWISFEPVVNAAAVLENIREVADFVDRVKIGKLNYHPSDIDWKKFGEEAEALCKELGLEYYIKDALRKEME